VPARARAVLDSNLLIRGLLRRQRRSAAVALLDAVMESRLRPVTSEYLLAEVDRTLREPEVRALRSLSDAQIDAFVTVLRDWLPWLRDATTWLSSRVTRLTTRCSRVPSKGVPASW